MNYVAILVCAVLAMALGFVWYGPLFGKKWMEISGMDKVDAERRKEMMRGVWKLYLTQFLLALFQFFVLAWYVGTLEGISGGVHTAFSMWIAFIVPTIASTCMWNNDSAKVSWTKFFIQAGYQLALFLIAGWVLGAW